MSNSTTASYKQLKEAFVSGHSGGPASEVYYVTTVAPVALLLWSALQARQSFFKTSNPLTFVVDFLLNVGAVLLATTLYADTPILLSLLLVAPAVLVLALPPNVAGSRRKKPRVPPPNAHSKAGSDSNGGVAGGRSNNSRAAAGTTTGPASSSRQQEEVLPLKAFLTNYRGGMLVVTCLAILAVDFRIFPRRFAKVETWGTSLMDMGVGSFVFSGGLVAARPVLKERASGRSTPLAQRVLYSMRHSLPLLALGFVRLLSVKGLDYAEHVTEYGVHWNFFFTLGFLPPFVAASQSALRLIPSYSALAILMGVVYQVLLESTRLKAYILTAPRVDLLSMNREGVFSFMGYLAIFLAGMDAGMYVLPRSLGPPQQQQKAGSGSGGGGVARRNALIVRLAVSSAVWGLLYHLTVDYGHGAGLTVSRRMANLPYVLWVVSFNSAQILAYCLVEAAFFPPAAGGGGGGGGGGASSASDSSNSRAEKEAYRTASSRILHAYNRNGLPIFLLANLLTGLVNMTVPTLDVGPVPTMGVLVAYAAILTGVAVGLDVYDISIKL